MHQMISHIASRQFKDSSKCTLKYDKRLNVKSTDILFKESVIIFLTFQKWKKSQIEAAHAYIFWSPIMHEYF